MPLKPAPKAKKQPKKKSNSRMKKQATHEPSTESDSELESLSSSSCTTSSSSSPRDMTTSQRKRGRPKSEATVKRCKLRVSSKNAIQQEAKTSQQLADERETAARKALLYLEQKQQRFRTYEQLTNIFPCLRIVPCEEYPDHPSIPLPYRGTERVMVCDECLSANRAYPYLSSNDYYKVRSHVIKHPRAGSESMSASTPSKPVIATATCSQTPLTSADKAAGQRTTEVPEKFYDYVMPVGALLSRLSESAIRRLIRAWSPFLSQERLANPLPVPSRRELRSVMTAHFRNAQRFIRKEITQSQPYICIAFDGGISRALGFHCLVTVAFSVTGVAVPLAIHYASRGATFNAESIARSLAITLSKYGIGLPSIRAVVADGAAAHHVAEDARYEILAKLAAASADNDLFEETDDIRQDNEYTDATQTLQRNSFAGAVSIRCRAHLAKTKIDWVHRDFKWKERSAATFAKAFAQWLGGDTCRPRQKRLLAALNAAHTSNPARSLVVQRIEIVLSHLRDTKRPEVLRRLVELIISDAEGDPILRDWVRFALDEWKETDSQVALERVLHKLKEQIVTKGDGVVAFATANATRWHSSLYLSYKFLAFNWWAIIAFIAQEDPRGMSEAKERMLSLTDTASKCTSLLNELLDYLACTRPVATFIDDAANYKIRSFEVCNRESQVFVELQSLLREAETQRNQLRIDLLTSTLNHWEDRNYRGESYDFFRCCAFLSPMHWLLVEPVT